MPEQRPPDRPSDRPPGPPRPPHSPPPVPAQAFHPPPPPKSYFVVKLAIFSIFAAGALGYYAWYVRGERDTKNALLIESKTAYGICADELQQTRTKTDQLGGEIVKGATAVEREKAAVEREKAAAEREKTLKETKEKELSATQTNLEATRAEVEELRKQRAEAEKRIAAFKELTAKFHKMIETGKLEVLVRDGRMIVKLPAGVLFASGKAELSSDGQMAIMEVAVVLKDFPDRKFMVAGHTDNYKPAKTSVYKDNWDLSTARAVEVTKFLIGAGMKSENLVAAGYGEYDPVKSNKSEGGRKENRRIEIVLLPNLDELPPMPEMGAADPSPTPAPTK